MAVTIKAAMLHRRGKGGRPESSEHYYASDSASESNNSRREYFSDMDKARAKMDKRDSAARGKYDMVRDRISGRNDRMHWTNPNHKDYRKKEADAYKKRNG